MRLEFWAHWRSGSSDRDTRCEVPEVTATTLTHRTNTQEQVHRYRIQKYKTYKYTEVRGARGHATTVTHRTNTHKIRDNALCVYPH